MIEQTIRTIVREELDQALQRVLAHLSKGAPTASAKFLNQKQGKTFDTGTKTLRVKQAKTKTGNVMHYRVVDLRKEAA